MLSIIGGIQVPVIPLGDVVLKVGAGSPEQIEIHEIGTIGPTVTVKVLVNAQGAGNRIWCENIIACSRCACIYSYWSPSSCNCRTILGTSW
jgi:hypothetical protein